MTLTPEERAKLSDFEQQYREGRLSAVQAVEQAVCGCVYGATSWATRDEVEAVARALALAPGVSLLEIGAGAGWPGLYLADRTGCDATLTDLPERALAMAMERADADGIAERCRAAVADGAALPFADASFDAIGHADVLCCLVQKRAVLDECRRVIRPGGRMAFSVIHVIGGLGGEDRAAALETAPSFADSEENYETLLGQTGWKLLERRDLSEAFKENCRIKIETEHALRAEFEALSGAHVVQARRARFLRRIAVLERGHLRRELFLARPAS